VRFIGSYILLPVKGNCVTAPVTEGRVLMTGSLRDKPNAEPSIKCDLDVAIVQVNCRTTS
jgi:hypothetical protein